jgi:hypothetical protein
LDKGLWNRFTSPAVLLAQEVKELFENNNSRFLSVQVWNETEIIIVAWALVGGRGQARHLLTPPGLSKLRRWRKYIKYRQQIFNYFLKRSVLLS